MPKHHNHSTRRRRSRRDDEPFEVPQPVFNPMAGFPRVLLPRGWKLRSASNWPVRWFLLALALSALLFVIALVLALVFGSPL